MNPLWVLVGIAIALLMVAPAAGPFGATALGLAGLFLAGAITKTLVDRYRNRRYDLRDLERIQVQEELDEAEDLGFGEIESITCPRCFREVHPRFSACPNCGSPL